MHAHKRLRVSKACLCLVLCLPLLGSCKDDYIYDDEEPSWLGANIYDYLEKEGCYKVYLSLINDLGYKETLSRTGSKTLFPANDEAFAKYFNKKGLTGDPVSIVQNLSLPAKRTLFNSSMLNMAYLDYMLANIASAGETGMGEGQALRKNSSASYLDSVKYVVKDKLPQTSYWSRFNERGGIYLADNYSKPIVVFTPQWMVTSGMTEEDWKLMFGDKPYPQSDFYVNGVRVTEKNKNITCKNGYLHAGDEVVTLLPNMAEVIENKSEAKIFGQLMDKFSAPYYDEAVDYTVKSYYADGEIKDSVFVKRYFNDANAVVDPNEQSVAEYGTLFFDPADNSWNSLADIGVMFLPDDNAMKEYWESDRGRFLKDVYGEWDNVPTDVLSVFLKNHQRRSFLSSLPHDWDIMTDESSFEMNMKPEDVISTDLACNGVVFLTNKVYPPIDYQCVYGPTLTAESTTIMKNAIRDKGMKFYLYLRSMENEYNLLVPTDEAMKEYREPISWAIWANGGVDNREIWSFRLVDNVIYADVYGVNADGTKGTFKRTLGAEDQSKIQNRLTDILDMHIVVADNEKEPLSGYMDDGTMSFALTKGGTILKANGGREDAMEVAGGGDIEQNLPNAKVVQLETGAGRYLMDNGRTFFMDRILQDPFKSVYTVMQEHEAFDEFYQLLLGNASVYAYFQDDDDVVPIFDQNATTSSSGIGQVVTSFNNYRYTVLVPTKEALEQAFRDDPNLWTWERIDMETDPTVKKEKCLYLLNFLKYHFIDGILPVAGSDFTDKEYETAARDENNQFVRVKVSSDMSGLTFKSEDTADEAHVLTGQTNDFNIMTRDYIVDNADYTKANTILASSRAVVHLVDHVLNYQKNN